MLEEQLDGIEGPHRQFDLSTVRSQPNRAGTRRQLPGHADRNHLAAGIAAVEPDAVPRQDSCRHDCRRNVRQTQIEALGGSPGCKGNQFADPTQRVGREGRVRAAIPHPYRPESCAAACRRAR